MMDFRALKQMVLDCKNIVFFGGAGTSTESGIPDFRSAEGLYNTEGGEKFPPEVVLSRDFFMKRPADFYRFYTSRMLYPDAKPNAAHRALAELERDGRLKAVITQNIDGLHQMAGSRCVLELHGSVHRNRCIRCHAEYPLSAILEAGGDVPFCPECGRMIKPDVVLYQEPLDQGLLRRAETFIEQAEMLIVAGTSLTVHPAAGLVHFYEGDKMILINKSPTPMDGLANYVIQDSVAKVLAALTAVE
jgi:NAD-dependent deacetylase